jgi:hypothetical protein
MKNNGRSPRINLAYLASLATVGALIVAIATFFLTFIMPPSGVGSGSSSPPKSSAEGNKAQDGSSSPETKVGLREGECLDELSAVASCDRPHSAEMISSDSACDLPTLVAYAGGTFATDTLRHDLVPTTVDAIGCVVNTPSGLATKIRDGLVSQDNAALRQCWDRFSQRDVTCDQSHTAEVVYSNPDPGTAETDCLARAYAYTGSAFGRYEAKLELLFRDSPDGVSCLVQVKGSNELKGSLRNLGTKALPIAPHG